jgi:serralysin
MKMELGMIAVATVFAWSQDAGAAASATFDGTSASDTIVVGMVYASLPYPAGYWHAACVNGSMQWGPRVEGIFDTITVNGLGGGDSIDVAAYVNCGGTWRNFYAPTGTLTVNGGSGSDTITGSTGSEYLNGGSGNDSIHGNEGDDVIHGDGDHDYIWGGAGDDDLYGDTGNDLIDGGPGAYDFLHGGAGVDCLNDTQDGVEQCFCGGDDGDTTNCPFGYNVYCTWYRACFGFP